MTEQTGLIKYETAKGEVQLSPDIVRKYLVSGPGKITDQEIMMFITLCRYQNLNPWLREAYLIKYDSENPATIVTGKETFLKRAERNPKYKGFKAGVILQSEKGGISYREGSMVTSAESLIGGWAEVYITSFETPIRAEVSFNEYAGRKKDGTLNRAWAGKPATMIRKVALVQALREAMPEEFGGLYSQEEINTVDILPELPIKPPLKEPQKKQAATPDAPEFGSEKPVTPSENQRQPSLEDKISEPQRRRFYALCKKGDKSDDAIKAKLAEYGMEHTADITRDIYEALVGWAEA